MSVCTAAYPEPSSKVPFEQWSKLRTLTVDDAAEKAGTGPPSRRMMIRFNDGA